MSIELDIYLRLALAFGIGLVVGIERGWRSRERPAGSRAAGIRTYTLYGLFGGIAGSVPADAAIYAGFAGVLVLVTAAYVTGLKTNPDRSITGEVAALITYSLGVLAVRGDMTLAAGCAVVLVAVLAAREAIHAWVGHIERVHLKAAIQLLVISVVILPVLPDQGYGPGGVLNPYELWWMVVIIVGISFMAMAAVAWLGPHRGLLLTAALGGFASSTAVAVGYARLARDTPTLSSTLAIGAGVATTLKFVRSLLVAAIIFPAGVAALAPGIVTAAALAGLATLLLARRGPVPAEVTAANKTNGNDLTVALSFAAVLAAVTLASHYAHQWFGALGVLAVAAASGLVDVDAVTVSTARQAVASGGDAAITMVLAVAVALAVNTLAKLVYISAIAGWRMAQPYALIAAAAFVGLAAGAAGTVL